MELNQTMKTLEEVRSQLNRSRDATDNLKARVEELEKEISAKTEVIKYVYNRRKKEQYYNRKYQSEKEEGSDINVQFLFKDKDVPMEVGDNGEASQSTQAPEDIEACYF